MWSKLMKKILFLAAVLSLSAFTSLVKAYEVRGFVFELEGNKVKITDYIGSENSLIIPQYLDGFEVTVIGENALNNKGLTNVTLPDSVQVIEESAFANNALIGIGFPASVVEIKRQAFYNNDMVNLTLPSNIEIVGELAFAENKLKVINYNHLTTDPAKSAFDTNINHLDYETNSGYLRLYYQTINSEIHIMGTNNYCYQTSAYHAIRDNINGYPVVAIHKMELNGDFCANMYNALQIPNSVRYIGKYAFTDLAHNEIAFGSSIEVIDDFAFFGFNGNSIALPNSVKQIGQSAFANGEINQLSLGNSIETIADSAFENNNIHNLTIPDSVKDIGEKAFFQNKLHTLQLGNSIETIGNSAFQNNRITSLTIPASVQTIGDYAFKSNYISELNLEQSQADIGVKAFRDNQISQVTIPETIGDISLDAFYGNQFTDVNYLGGGSEFYFIGDSDQDGVFDVADAFPFDASESEDFDSDGIGDNADTDDDNDGHFDLLDAFPLDASEWMDTDSDGVGNNADTDDDNDGVLDLEDVFPLTESESVDTDGDGVGDNSDAFPNDSSETLDTDLDGIGNNADADDDNDGVVDAEDINPLDDSVGAIKTQDLFVIGDPVGVNGYLATIGIGYDVSDANNALNGIGFRVHFDSSILSFSGVQNILMDSAVIEGMGPYQDTDDFDNDSTTDSFIVFGWASVTGDWPNDALPAKLSDIQFFVSWDGYEAGSTTSNINFSIVDNAENYQTSLTNHALTVLPGTWDFDGNASADALTDGLMLLRYTFGIRDMRMTSGAMAGNSTLSAIQVVDNMHRAATLADIDGNGSTDALTDGLLLLRYLFGLRGENLISGAISSDATRTTQEQIEQYLSLYMPSELTLPVQSEQSFIVGDWKLAEIPQQKNVFETSWYGHEYGLDQEIFENCVHDDIYRFGNDATFQYLINGSTFMDSRINPLYWSTNEYCVAPLAPWDESEIYTYSIDKNNSNLTVHGLGAYIGLADIVNGGSIESPSEAPDSISYSYSIISEDQILLELDAFSAHYRFTLERVPRN
ncbi:MAG: leucine-rich repeat protein [Porticoccaceae bacterium]